MFEASAPIRGMLCWDPEKDVMLGSYTLWLVSPMEVQPPAGWGITGRPTGRCCGSCFGTAPAKPRGLQTAGSGLEIQGLGVCYKLGAWGLPVLDVVFRI